MKKQLEKTWILNNFNPTHKKLIQDKLSIDGSNTLLNILQENEMFNKLWPPVITIMSETILTGKETVPQSFTQFDELLKTNDITREKFYTNLFDINEVLIKLDEFIKVFLPIAEHFFGNIDAEADTLQLFCNNYFNYISNNLQQ